MNSLSHATQTTDPLASGYGVVVEWVRLILDFLASVAWPFVVLVLGFGFRKPLMDLFDNGTMTKLSVGPTGMAAEWEVEARVERAKDPLESAPTESDPPDLHGAEDDHGVPAPPEFPAHEPEKPPVPESPTDEPLAREPSTPAPPASNDRDDAMDRLPADMLKLAHVDPALAILQCAETLTQDLTDVMRRFRTMGVPSKGTSLLTTIQHAHKFGLLSDEEATAGMELAKARNRLAHADKNLRVDFDTALDFIRASQRLIRSARRASRLQAMTEALQAVSRTI